MYCTLSRPHSLVRHHQVDLFSAGELGRGALYNWALQATDQQGVILTSYYALQVLMAIIPLVFLRLSMSTRITVQPAEGDSDMQSL